jgi:hypothetical protein
MDVPRPRLLPNPGRLLRNRQQPQPLYSEASVAEEIEEARQNDLARKGHTDDTKEHVRP